MKIKKLSIQGFKSFMDRLEINFPEGVSGVVGPNGCGKSNIVDAIRWCMGEQSPKMLRGRRMEDVIFGGAGNDKPMGMAEVSLLFENGDGSFPPAFAQDAEMSVTRRLYRSGESEYLINRVPCRLKDIQEIFMDTGLGNRAYSIIGQGQIGTIIEQKPEETRVMLEEAAGITKYRKKVEASQRKIELTEANLQRVEDILGEVRKQMRSLKRQASKARRYKAVCEEIRNLELILYANSFNELKKDSGNRQKSAEELVQQELAKSATFSRHQARIETMNVELEERDADLLRYRRDHLDLREGVHKKEAGIESLTQEMRMQEEQETRLREEQQDIRKRLENLKNEKSHLQEELNKMEKRSHEVEGEASIKEKRLKARHEFLKEIKDEYEKARARLNDGVNKEMGLNHESGYLNKMLGQITDSRSRLEKELEGFKDKIETILRASERKSSAREAAVERLQGIEEAIEQQNINFEELEQGRKGVELELRSAEADLNVCRSRLASLKSLSENFEGYKMGVRTIMKAKDLEPIKQGRILGLVADIIQVEPAYEQAVETVLADRLQYMIVESQEDGRQAIDYLKTRKRGRGSFVPIKDIKANGNGKTEATDFTLLPELVSVPDPYKPLINALLGDAVLVEDLEQAISLWKANGTEYCFVTMDGDVIDQRGVISGGKLTHRSSGLLARKREISELKERSVQYQKNVDDLKRKLEKTVTAIQGNKKSMEDLAESKWSCQDEINEFDKILFRLGQELDQLEKLSQKISQDMERQDIEERKHKKELSRIEEEIDVRKARRKEEEEYFLQKEIELKESEEEFERFRDEVSKLHADYRIIKEAQRGLIREMEMKDDFADESLKRLEKIEEDILNRRQRRDECRIRKETLREELQGVYDRLKESEDVVNRAEQERQAFLSGIKQEENTAEELREEIATLKEEISRAKMEHSEIQFRMNGLVEMAREKAHLDLNQVYEQYLDENFSASEIEGKLEHQKLLKQRLGDVNLTAIKEHEALKERYEFIKSQREDLIRSIESLQLAIRKINRTSLEKFEKAFREVDAKLKEIFPILFNGGTAGLKLTDETKPLESGILVEVRPPGKKLSHMGLLSGGEKALVAMALLFAIYMVKPSPFCLLDEVDAPLDEANVDRFNELIKEIKRSSQIIMVTHSRRTMEIADRLYGITMEKAGISKTVTVDIEGMRETAPKNEQAGQPTVH